ncbi:hypothetical protein FD733_08720 [Pantoea sp. Eser]|nr:hypothetical protein [Pantoea sp. Eser]
MTNLSDRRLKTGSDPRAFASYAALRNELAKLTHPARPDVNWSYVEKRCVALFEHNGVELQSAAWYTLARTHLGGLAGLNEGLSLLEALINHQWNTFWPQSVPVRLEMLSNLSQRIQQLLQTFSLSASDYSALYLAEQQLTRLEAVLQRRELNPLSQLNALHSLIQHSVARLKNNEGLAGSVADSEPEADFTNIGNSAASVPETDLSDSEVKGLRQVPPEHKPEVEKLTTIPAATLWKPFALGMFTMLVAVSVALWGWQALQRSDPLHAQLASSLTVLPSGLSPRQLEELRQQAPLPEALFTATQQQLARLSQLPPDWTTAYSHQLVKQAQILWPEKSRALMTLQLQQQMNAAALPVEAISGWHQGMTELQHLADRLNALDKKRGNYLTVSELKTAVFDMMTHFRQTVPAEEQLRLIHLQPDDSPASQQQIQQAEQHLRAQAYALMMEKERETTANSF